MVDTNLLDELIGAKIVKFHYNEETDSLLGIYVEKDGKIYFIDAYTTLDINSVVSKDEAPYDFSK